MDEQILKELKEGTEPEVFGEALAFLEQKGVIRYEDFRKLKEWYRPLAFSVAGYTELEVLNQFLEELKRAIGEGTTRGSCIACGPYGTGRRRTQSNTMRR